MIIEPKIKEYCSVIQALEYLGLGWKPYEGNDERFSNTADERIRMRCYFTGEPYNKEDRAMHEKHGIRTPEQVDYYNIMYNAIGKLEYLIREKKINTIRATIQGNVSEEEIKKHVISKVCIYPCCDIFVYTELGKSVFAYNKNDDVIKFSEIEPYYENKPTENENISKKYIENLILEQAKKLAEEGITNNAAAKEIKKTLVNKGLSKEGCYPSLQKIRDIICEIIPTNKR
jgi:hypothetical protein